MENDMSISMFVLIACVLVLVALAVRAVLTDFLCHVAGQLKCLTGLLNTCLEAKQKHSHSFTVHARADAPGLVLASTDPEGKPIEPDDIVDLIRSGDFIYGVSADGQRWVFGVGGWHKLVENKAK
jgi:hypothetical protein